MGVAVHVNLAMDHLVPVLCASMVRVGAQGLGEVSVVVGDVEVYCLATAVRGLYGSEQGVSLFLVTSFSREAEGRGTGRAIGEMGRYGGLWLERW